jgi:hypothetical protein
MLPGAPEMRGLALATLAALEAAGLPDLARMVRERVLDRPADELVEAYRENDLQRWRFRPITELLLRDIREAALERRLPEVLRRGRIQWTLEMAGL